MTRVLDMHWPSPGKRLIVSDRDPLNVVASNTALRVLRLGLGSAVLAITLLQLTRSLPESQQRSADALTFELRDLAAGSYRSFDGRNSRLYIVRTLSDEVRAFTVPLRAAKVAMPDAHWGRSAYDCTDFRPGATDSPLIPTSVFRCRDADVPAWGIYQWRWGVDGKSAAQLPHSYIDDMPRVSIERTADVVRVHGWDIQW